MSDDELRAAIEGAFDDDSGDVGDRGQEDSAPDAGGEGSEVAAALEEGAGALEGDGASADQSGQASSEDDAQSAEGLDTGRAEGDKPGNEEEGAAGTDAEESEFKPPIDWSADVREQWSKLPVDVQRQITDRERAMAQAMAHTAEAKKTHESLSDLARTYAPVMAAEGVSDPLVAVNGLMQTVSQLRLGSPVQKAQKMAALIEHYGVDIDHLDHALVGSVKDEESNKFEQMLDQKMAPVNEMMSNLAQLQQGNQQQQISQVQEELDAFSKKAEFINDVRTDMADILDFAHSRGQEMTLQQAYDRACSLHPTVAKVLEARRDQELARKAAASSSIKGNGAPPKATKDMTLEDTLREVWGS